MAIGTLVLGLSRHVPSLWNDGISCIRPSPPQSMNMLARKSIKKEGEKYYGSFTEIRWD